MAITPFAMRRLMSRNIPSTALSASRCVADAVEDPVENLSNRASKLAALVSGLLERRTRGVQVVFLSGASDSDQSVRQFSKPFKKALYSIRCVANDQAET